MVSRKKSGPKRTKKGSPKKRTKKSYSSAQKLKNITIQDKLALYLNDALSIENARYRKTAVKDKANQITGFKSTTATSFGGNKRTAK